MLLWFNWYSLPWGKIESSQIVEYVEELDFKSANYFFIG